VPAITLEIGPAKVWKNEYIDRAEQFIYRLLADLEMLPNSTRPTPDLSNTYKATNTSSVYTPYSGFVNVTVGILDDVEADQEFATVYNAWGDVLTTLKTTVAGRVHTVQTDPVVEMGSEILRIVYNATES
jgi:predicted deacylase